MALFISFYLSITLPENGIIFILKSWYCIVLYSATRDKNLRTILTKIHSNIIKLQYCFDFVCCTYVDVGRLLKIKIKQMEILFPKMGKLNGFIKQVFQTKSGHTSQHGATNVITWCL